MTFATHTSPTSTYQGEDMIVKKLRLQRGWSQEHLAELTDLSVRTIQRLERGHKPGLETIKSLAAVFEVGINTFDTGDSDMNTQQLKADEVQAMQYVKGVVEFYSHLLMYVVFSSVFLLNGGWNIQGIHWPFLGWGLGLIMHGLWSHDAFNWITPPKWELRMVEKRLGRKL
jgi:XRE family transcriptional regulator, regulator of sulfur utilization